MKNVEHKEDTKKEEARQPVTEPVEIAEPSYQVVSTQWMKQAAQYQQDVAQLKDQMLRMRADFDNSRKRIQKEREESVRYANESLIEELLPVLDNFDLGLKAANTAQDTASIVQGINMVYTQFQRLLNDLGVKVIDAMGQKFDPHLHEAVDQTVDTSVPDGTIVGQHRKGYMLHDRLIRPASVIVAHAKASTETASVS